MGVERPCTLLARHARNEILTVPYSVFPQSLICNIQRAGLLMVHYKSVRVPNLITPCMKYKFAACMEIFCASLPSIHGP